MRWISEYIIRNAGLQEAQAGIKIARRNINNEAQVLNDTLDEMDPIDTFRAFHPNPEEYTFFSSTHGTFSKIDHILGHKSNLNKFKKIEIVSDIFSDHNAMKKLGINYKKKKTVRNTNTWRLNSMFLNNQKKKETFCLISTCLCFLEFFLVIGV